MSRRHLSALLPFILVTPSPALELRTLLEADAMPGWEEKPGDDGKLPAKPTWDIQNGVLRCNGKGGGAWWGSKQDYTDFILDFEFKLPPAGNSGVFLRAPRPGQRVVRTTQPEHATPAEAALYTWHPTFAGMEVQILDDDDPLYTQKMKILPGQHCGAIYKIAAPTKQVLKKAGEWNHMRITAVADHITVELNGETIVDADGKSHPEILQRCRKGPIGFQYHSSDLWFRNIRLADLAAPLKPAKDDSITLSAFDGCLHGRRIRRAPDAPLSDQVITAWSEPGDHVTWDVELPRRGRYGLELRYAGPAGGKFEVTAGSARLAGQITEGTAADEPRTLRLGELNLPAGRVTLRIKPVEIPKDHGLMNLLSAKLTPIHNP